MQLIGHELIPYENYKMIKEESCFKIKKDDYIIFKFNKKIISIAKENNLNFSLICENINEAIIANAVGAQMIICEKQIAKSFSDLAQKYLFDSKIACFIKNEEELEELSNLDVDVAIFENKILNN